MFEFKDKVAFVTGGASGIGFAVAQALADEGCRVAIADIDEKRLEAAKDEFRGDVLPVRLNVTDAENWAEARRTVEKELGQTDILVQCAGFMDTPGAPMVKRGIVDYSKERWDRMVSISLTGIGYGLMEFGPGIRDRKRGYIINTASTQGIIPTRGVACYSASKFGVVGLTEALQQELEDDNIGVSVLIPGVVKTRLAFNELKRIGVKAPFEIMPFGMEAEEVGRIVIDGMKKRKLHIITHGEYRKYCEERMQELLHDFDDVAISADYDPGKPLAGTKEWARATAEAEKAKLNS